MKKLFYWILITISLFAIVRDTNAISSNAFPLPWIYKTGGILSANTNDWNWQFWYTSYVEIDNYVRHDKLGCFKVTNSTTDWYVYTLGMFNWTYSMGVDFFILSDQPEWVKYIVSRIHNEFTSSFSAPQDVSYNNSLFNNPITAIDFVIPYTVNSGGDVPGEWVVCTKVVTARVNDWSIILSAITYTYYGFQNWQFLHFVKEYPWNILLTQYSGSDSIVWWGSEYTPSKQAIANYSNASGSATYWKFASTTGLFDYRVVTDFLKWTWTTEYVQAPTLPSYLNYDWINIDFGTGGTWWGGTWTGDIDTGTYYDECEGFTDLWCYIWGFTQFIFDIPGMIFDKIIDAILSLVPDITFSWTFDSCSADFNSEDATSTDKLKNFLAFLNPFMPPWDWEIVCTVWGEEELHYSRLIPEQNFFELYLPNAPAYLTVSPYILPWQTIFDIVLIAVMMGMIFYKRHH